MIKGDDAIEALKGRIIKEVGVSKFCDRKIITITTHDGFVVMFSGDNAIITSQKLD